MFENEAKDLIFLQEKVGEKYTENMELKQPLQNCGIIFASTDLSPIYISAVTSFTFSGLDDDLKILFNEKSNNNPTIEVKKRKDIVSASKYSMYSTKSPESSVKVFLPQFKTVDYTKTRMFFQEIDLPLITDKPGSYTIEGKDKHTKGI